MPINIRVCEGGLETSLSVIGVPVPLLSSLLLLHGKVSTVHILLCGWAFADRFMSDSLCVARSRLTLATHYVSVYGPRLPLGY